MREAGASGKLEVEVQRFGHFALHGAIDAMAVAGNYPHAHAVNRRELRDLCGLDVAIPRRAHLVLRGEIEPQLEAFHAAILLLGKLRMDYSAASRHPLHAAVLQ